MIGRLFHICTLTLLLSGSVVLSCGTQSSASFGRLECPDMRQYANHNKSDCAHDVDCRRKGPGVDSNMKCCPTGKSNTHLCVVPTKTFNSSVDELQPTRKAILPKAEACNPLCRDGLVCRVFDGKAACVATTCATILCVTGTTCVEQKGRDAICVAQNKPGFCPEQTSRRPCIIKRDNFTDQCADDAGCADDQKCCADVCRKECKTPVNPCAVVRCGFDTTCIVVDGRPSCQPPSRPGQCPVITIGCTVLPVRNCEDDSVCASGEKCCPDKCGIIGCTAAQPVCTRRSCSTVAGPSVCVEVTTTSQHQKTNVLPKCSAPSSTNDFCTGKSNACKAGQTCLVTRRCFDQLNEVCFPAVTCSDPIKENPCNLIDCKPNQQCVVQKSLPPQALCVDNPPPGTKPGQCPTLPTGTIGTCVEACTNDFNCTGDSKCCSNGCGHVCKAPAKSATTPITPTKSTTPVSTTTLAPPTCAGVKCPHGECCQLQTIFCVRAPCPPALPRCVDCQSTSTSTPITTTPKTGKTKYL